MMAAAAPPPGRSPDAGLLRALVEHLQVPLAHIDPQGRVRFVNRRFTDTLGYTLDDVPDLARWWALAFPEPDRRQDARDRWAAALQQASRVGDPIAVDTHWVTVHDGSKRLLEIAGVLLEEGFLVTFTDVTEHHLARERLEASEAWLTRSQQIAHIGSWQLELHGRHRLVWSDEMYRILGVSPQHFDLSHRSFLQTVHPDDRLRLDEQLRRTRSGEQDTLDLEHRVVRPGNGEVRHVHARCVLERDPSGQPWRLVGTVQDITERKVLDTALTALGVDMALLEGRALDREACLRLTQTLDMDVAFVGRLSDNGRTLEVIEGWADGEAIAPWSFVLEGTPSQEAVQHGQALFRDGVDALFPAAHWLSDQRIRAYVGHVLLDRQGQAMGVLAAWSRRPLSPTFAGLAPAVLQHFAGRLGAEWRRERADLERQRQANFQRLAAELAAELVSAVNPGLFDAALNRLLARLGEMFAVDRSYVFMLSPDTVWMSNTHEWCAEGISSEKEGLQNVALDQTPWWKARMLADGLIHVPQVQVLPEEARVERSILEAQGIRSLLMVCMTGASGRLSGFMGLDRVRCERPWSSDDIAMLRVMAGLVGSALERLRAKEALSASETRFRTLADDLPSLVCEFLTDSTLTYVNRAYADFFGVKPAALLGQHWLHSLPEGIRAEVQTQYRSLTPEHPTRRYTHEVQTGGEQRWMEWTDRAVFDDQGQALKYISIGTDITERQQTEETLRQAASVFEHADEGIFITNPEGVILDVNRAFSRITGFAKDEVVGQTPRVLQSGRHDAHFYTELWRHLTERGHWSGEVWNRRKRGDVYPEMLTISAMHDPDGHVRRYVAMFSDISALKEQQRQLEHMAHYDALTGLPNRSLLADRLQQTMAQVMRRRQKLAVVYLDLDGFKAVNDNHGHAVGDQLLTAVAARLKAALREGDTLARLGGDEFVAVLLDLPDVAHCLPVLARLLAVAAEPVQAGEGRSLRVSASLGVTFYPQDEEVDADQLLRQADQAMYQAKLTGKNRYHLFDAAHDRHVRGRHEGLEQVRQALHRGEFVLHYQPKVNMRSGEVLGVEALIRWQHPTQGLLPPSAFLPLLARHPLMLELGDWVLDTALTQVGVWREAGLRLPVSVNIDAMQLEQPDWVDRLKERLKRQPSLQAGDLELEVLESSGLQDVARTSSVMRACKALGVGFALDDFGTGYASLTYLKRLPSQTVKLDQSFIRDMLDDPDDLAILASVLGLAESLGKQALAEGVETLAHGELLLRLGCVFGQGYAIAAPMPATEVPAWVRAWRPDPTWATLRPVQPVERPVLFAMAEHRAWVTHLEHSLRSGEAAPPLDPRTCRFGQWLQAETVRRGLKAHMLAPLQALHDLTHHKASELIAWRDQGRSDLAMEGLEQVRAWRERLLDELRRLIQDAAG